MNFFRYSSFFKHIVIGKCFVIFLRVTSAGTFLVVILSMLDSVKGKGYVVLEE